MIRTIVTPNDKTFTLVLPDNFLGKQIEVIAFVVEVAIQRAQKKVSFTVLEVAEDLKKSYLFNRDEANER